MSINVMQRQSLTKRDNCCSRNCLNKSISTSVDYKRGDHSKCSIGLKDSHNLLPCSNLTLAKKFIVPMPLSKSTTYERKFKSIFAQREAEYDKNLKSIKVNLFKNGSMTYRNDLKENIMNNANRMNKFKPNTKGVISTSVSTSMNFSKKLSLWNKDRERSRSIHSKKQHTTCKAQSILEKSTPAQDSIMGSESSKLSEYNDRINTLYQSDRQRDEFYLMEENFTNNRARNEEKEEFKEYMRKEEEVNLEEFSKENMSLKMNLLGDSPLKEDEPKEDLHLLSEKDSNKMFERLMNDQLIFNTNANTVKTVNTINTINTISTVSAKVACDYSLPQSLRQSHKNQNYNLNLQMQYDYNQSINHMTNNNLASMNSINLLPVQLSYINPNFIQENINKINLGLFTSNYENLKTNKESAVKFTREEYRKVLSTFLRFEYGKSILEDMYKEEELNEKFLHNHQITERMRMRMIDWMIEVLCNYKCEDNTFFLAVNILDRYFKLSGEPLQPEGLHLVGVVAMFIASKFYDVYPMKLKLIVDKVSHGKFTADEVKMMEEKIVKTLNYEILKPTSFEFMNYYFEEIFYFIENNFMVTDDNLSEYFKHLFTTCGIEIKFDHFYYEKNRSTKNFTYKMLNLVKNVVLYLAKMNCHDYTLIGIKPSLLAASTILVAMKICEQINNQAYVNDYFTCKLCEISKLKEFEILFHAQKILYNAQNFDSCFSGLENLKKVHFNHIMELKEEK